MKTPCNHYSKKWAKGEFSIVLNKTGSAEVIDISEKKYFVQFVVHKLSESIGHWNLVINTGIDYR